MLSRFENESGRSAPCLFRFDLILAALCAVLALGLASTACGPSVQSIYEGNVRFEHCYRLDLEVDTAPTHREACWKEWLGKYTYGQPRDRIEYARRRAQAFASGDVDRPSLHVTDVAEQKSEARQFYLVVPSPTSVHASPPPVATRLYADGGPPAETTEQEPAPAEPCVTACREKRRECTEACDVDAGKVDAGKVEPCKKCDTDYKGCMKRCFQ